MDRRRTDGQVRQNDTRYGVYQFDPVSTIRDYEESPNAGNKPKAAYSTSTAAVLRNRQCPRCIPIPDLISLPPP